MFLFLLLSEGYCTLSCPTFAWSIDRSVDRSESNTERLGYLKGYLGGSRKTSFKSNWVRPPSQITKQLFLVVVISQGRSTLMRDAKKCRKQHIHTHTHRPTSIYFTCQKCHLTAIKIFQICLQLPVRDLVWSFKDLFSPANLYLGITRLILSRVTFGFSLPFVLLHISLCLFPCIATSKTHLTSHFSFPDAILITEWGSRVLAHFF